MNDWTLKKISRILIAAGLIFLSVYGVFIYLIYRNKGVFLTNYKDFGDTVGGVGAPVIGVVAIATTFLAFWIQYEANRRITNQFTKERFETKVYELLRLHRENVAEINIQGKYSGRQAIVKMYEEFRFLYYVVANSWDEVYKKGDTEKSLDDLKRISELAYIILFYGVAELSEKGAQYHTGHYDVKLIDLVVIRLIKYQKKCSGLLNLEQRSTTRRLSVRYKGKKHVWNTMHYPFDGYVAQLGHYYRHLYQSFKYVIENHPDVDRDKEEIRLTVENETAIYEYIKLFRVQLSNHEQTMIYYNSFFVAGKVWWSDSSVDVLNHKGEHISYFLDFIVIKNIPFNLTDFIGPDPKIFFLHMIENRKTKHELSLGNHSGGDEIRRLFEWLE